MAGGYQIGTRAMAVDLSMSHGARFSGEMFLRLGGPSGAESVAERLNDGAPFFPVRTPPSDPAQPPVIVLVGKAQLRYLVAPPVDEDDPVAEQRASLPQFLVTAELEDGELITGVFFVDLPPGQARTLDYVNDTTRAFVPLAQLDREYLINRSFIRTLRDVRG